MFKFDWYNIINAGWFLSAGHIEFLMESVEHRFYDYCRFLGSYLL